MELCDANATKRPVNLSINSDLIEKARAVGLNLSALAEEAIIAAYAKAARAKWDDEIRQACEVHNRYIADHGTLAEAIWAMEEEDEAAATMAAAPHWLDIVRHRARRIPAPHLLVLQHHERHTG